MNANQIVNMVIRMVMRKLLRGGVNAGINAVGNRMNKGKTAENQKNAGPDTSQTTKRAKQAMRVTRRMGKF